MATFKIGKVLMRSLFKKPATLMYPVIPREFQERTRGSIAIDKDACILCGICGKKCPANAIEVDRAAGTWTIERMRCVQCGCCVDECPKKCLEMLNPYTTPDTTKTVDTFEVPKQEKKSGASGGKGKLVCDKEACVFCGLCVKNCPCDALKVDRENKIWEVSDACVQCGACVDKCPKKCLSISEDEKAQVKEDGLKCDKEACVFCGLCAKNCPCDALTVDRENKVWEVSDACVQCGVCVEKCPKKCLSL